MSRSLRASWLGPDVERDGDPAGSPAQLPHTCGAESSTRIRTDHSGAGGDHPIPDSLRFHFTISRRRPVGIQRIGSQSFAPATKGWPSCRQLGNTSPEYGAWETVASNITEGLVSRGWDVTLFATRDSVTRAHLHAVVDRGYEEDPAIDPKVAESLHISEAFEHAAEFDLIHSHYDFMALSYTRLVKTPVLTTIHGFSSPKIMPVYEKYRDGYFVSISDSDRAPGLNYLATVYNGIDLSLYPIQELGGDHLVFLGRIHPDKGVHLASRRLAERVAAAHRGIIQDSLLPRAGGAPPRSDIHTSASGRAGQERVICEPEPAAPEHHPGAIRLVSEANAAGVPVIATDLGSCREVIKDGQTGFLVNNVDEAVQALKRLGEIDRCACRQRVQECFSIETMVKAYERVYRTVFDVEETRRS
jgi:glycosyltransferase involved in cell wall biosynthesis